MKNELRPLLATFAGLMFALPWIRAQDWFGGGDEGGRIVFALQRPGLSQICVADADGSVLKKLTPPEMIAGSPSWSPDGKTIVFVSLKDKRTCICTVDSDGGRLRTLAEVGNVNRWPRWSPDGKRISFVSSRDSTNPKYPANDIELYVMDADGTNLQRLAPKECVDTMSWIPRWSPDGSEILFVRVPAGKVRGPQLPARLKRRSRAFKDGEEDSVHRPSILLQPLRRSTISDCDGVFTVPRMTITVGPPGVPAGLAEVAGIGAVATRSERAAGLGRLLAGNTCGRLVERSFPIECAVG